MIRLAGPVLLAAICMAGPSASAQTGRPEAATPEGGRPSAEGGRPSAEGGRPSAEGGRPSAFSGLSGSAKEPIKIDADRLEVFDKEQRAVFSGNVVAVQGDSTMKCTSLTVLYEQGKAPGAAQAPAGPGGGDGAIRKIDCKGPVTVTAKTQVATSDNATFDRVQNKIFLTGNAALSDGPNVTKGDRVVYDLNTSRATIEGRVRALIVPGSGSTPPGGPAPEKKAPSPSSPARAATN